MLTYSNGIIMSRSLTIGLLVLAVSFLCALGQEHVPDQKNTSASLYDVLVEELVEKLKSTQVDIRAGAAENLGYLRAYSAAEALAFCLKDKSAKVRREAALSLS